LSVTSSFPGAEKTVNNFNSQVFNCTNLENFKEVFHQEKIQSKIPRKKNVFKFPYPHVWLIKNKLERRGRRRKGRRERPYLNYFLQFDELI